MCLHNPLANKDSESSYVVSDMLGRKYFCDCPRYCKGRQRQVSCSTYVRHLSSRPTLRSPGFQQFLASGTEEIPSARGLKRRRGLDDLGENPMQVFVYFLGQPGNMLILIRHKCIQMKSALSCLRAHMPHKPDLENTYTQPKTIQIRARVQTTRARELWQVKRAGNPRWIPNATS